MRPYKNISYFQAQSILNFHLLLNKRPIDQIPTHKSYFIKIKHSNMLVSIQYVQILFLFIFDPVELLTAPNNS